MKYYQIILLFIFILSQFCSADETKGRFEPYSNKHHEHIKRYHIPRPATWIKKMQEKPFRFAKSVPTMISFDHNKIIHTKDTWRWIIKIESTDALSLSLIFDHWWIPKGSEVYIYNEEDTLGVFTANKSTKKFATRPLKGDSLYLEYISPKSIRTLPIIDIHRVVYGYKPLEFLSTGISEYRAIGQYPFQSRTVRHRSGKCNIDLTCDSAGSDWFNEARSVVILLTDENQMYCTGVLINNALNDGRQLLLTAYHCNGGHSNSSNSDLVIFNHQKRTCGSSLIKTNSLDSMHGLNFLAGSSISDFALFEIQEPIPKRFNVYLAGWTTMILPKPPLVGIHHPSGDFKKLSIYDGNLIPSCWDECPDNDHLKIQKWTRGTTEPGSSGSPLFDNQHLVVGQLHGGSAACWNKNGYDIYGSLNASWHLGLSTFLNPNQNLLQNTSTGSFQLQGVYLNTLLE